MPVLGGTEAEAAALAATFEEQVTDTALVAQLSTALGVELDERDIDRTLSSLVEDGVPIPPALRKAMGRLEGTNARVTLRLVARQSLRAGRVVGTPERIADEITAVARG
jgi:alkanesulfonate monooxygenase SsuD/methylene tetrahydromethanopterin reductase-like flavin-dependent oxidoreductase (luciferase family)